MTLKQIGLNLKVVSIGSKRILFSYSTPVAYEEYGECFRTGKHWSKTTSRHINKWLEGIESQVVPQEQIDALSK